MFYWICFKTIFYHSHFNNILVEARFGDTCSDAMPNSENVLKIIQGGKIKSRTWSWSAFLDNFTSITTTFQSSKICHNNLYGNNVLATKNYKVFNQIINLKIMFYATNNLSFHFNFWLVIRVLSMLNCVLNNKRPIIQ